MPAKYDHLYSFCPLTEYHPSWKWLLLIPVSNLCILISTIQLQLWKNLDNMPHYDFLFISYDWQVLNLFITLNNSCQVHALVLVCIIDISCNIHRTLATVRVEEVASLLSESHLIFIQCIPIIPSSIYIPSPLSQSWSDFH